MERIKGISQEMEDLDNIPQSDHNTSGSKSLGGKDLITLEKQEEYSLPALPSQTTTPTTNIPAHHIEAIKVCHFKGRHLYYIVVNFESTEEYI